MAAFALSTEYTLMEVAKTIGAEGNDLALADTLSQKMPFLEEGYWMEADDFNSHHFLQALAEPTGSDSVANIGVSWETYNTTPVTELIQGVESYMRIDTRILSKKRNPELFLKQQTDGFISGLKKTIHDRLLYGNTALYPDRINGLQVRFNTLTTRWKNVTGAGGSTSNALQSTWAIQWGPNGAFFVYPHGGQDFLKMTDFGEQLVYDSNRNPYTARIFRFLITFGLCVADPRRVQRLANIDLAAQSGGKLWTADLQLQALGKLPDGIGDAVIYVPRDVYTQIVTEANDKSNTLYTVETMWSQSTFVFYGCPIRMCERLTATEAQVS